jgi:cellulose synthase/poly-beta-1,6-N-acetylglucosamine synthase-like glycosyltransferase
VRNEVGSIRHLVLGVMEGSYPPDEFVIADAGSTDGTREELDRLASEHARVRVLDVAGNRSRGRNAAIAAARGGVIACIDGGCIPARDWLGELVAPFSAGAEWVGGFYRPSSDSVRSVCIGLTMVFVLEEAMAGGFIPSARSMAFSKAAWGRVGGFPEDLEVSEDTAFDEAMSEAGFELVFRPEAIVEWVPPRTFREQARVQWTWSRSDGLAGIRSFAYVRTLWFVAVSGSAVVAIALLDARFAVLGLLPFVALMWRQTRHKYRWTKGVVKFLWIPCAWLVGLVSSSAGFLAGRLRRSLRSPH